MLRATLPFLLILMLTACSPPPDATARQKQIRTLADDYWEFYLRENPESATVFGEYKYNAKLSDYSLAHVEEARKQMADLLARAKTIDIAGLPDSDRLDQQLLVQTLTDHLDSIRFKTHELPLDQMN